MLSPNHIVFLPQDREIMDITGMSEEQYRWFVKQAVFHSKVKPSEPTAFLNFVIPLVIGIALQAAAALLSPRQTQQQPERKEQQRLVVRTLSVVNVFHRLLVSTAFRTSLSWVAPYHWSMPIAGLLAASSMGASELTPTCCGPSCISLGGSIPSGDLLGR